MNKKKAIATVKRAREVVDRIAEAAVQRNMQTDAAEALNLAMDLQEVLTYLRNHEWQP